MIKRSLRLGVTVVLGACALCAPSPATVAVPGGSEWSAADGRAGGQPAGEPERAAAEPEPATQTGLFLILVAADSPEELPEPAAGQRIARYDYRFLRAEERGEPEYFLLNRRPDVPLLLAAPPRTIEGDRGLPELLIELTEEAADEMERVTRENLGKSAAFVIDGEVVTAHKIRAVIRNGLIQLTRCTDTACEYILARLQAR